MFSPSELEKLERIVGAEFLRTDPETLAKYGVDALQRGRLPDAVVLPGSAAEVSAVARWCDRVGVPLVVRGAGTGYTGGAVPLRGGIVMGLDRMNRILEIDEENLLAVVEPNVVTGDLQRAVESVGLFYPPDPASLEESTIGGNVAECAGGPRAFKYGTTKRYVLGLEAVLPSGEVVKTGSKTVKNVVGYDLTQLLTGSEGTLAIITKVILRLVPRPPYRMALRAIFPDVETAALAVSNLLRARVVPATLELIDGECLHALERHTGTPLAPEGAGAALLIECDGMPQAVQEEIARVEQACRDSGGMEVLLAGSDAERVEVWRVRRELSASLRALAPSKFNHDVVVPRGRVPALFALIGRLREELKLRMPCFGHAGDGNIHVNIMADPGDAEEMDRVRRAERELFEGVIRLEGSISGEHGIGFSKAPFLPLELSPSEIALMKRVKEAFDPRGLLNPGKIFPD
jgi:glycolate oxidase